MSIESYTWFTLAPITIVTISMWEGGNITDPLSIGHIIAVSITHTWPQLTDSIIVTEVLSMAVTVLTTLAGVAGLVTHRSWVLTVQSTVMASCKAVYIIIVCNKSYGIFTWATTISVMRAVILSTVEAVVMLSIADLVKSITFCICQAHIELTDSIIVTEVLCMAVTIIITLAGVVSQVTDRSRVLTIQSTVMAS